MDLSHAMQGAVNWLAAVPVVKQAGRRASRRRFERNRDANLFFGVFDSFEAAAASAPQSRPVGYDNSASADLYASNIFPSDYPAMFWLAKSFSEGLRSVFDLGGHVGIKYYAFRRTLSYPQALIWTVCDVPAVVARGRELALARAPEGALHFTDRYAEASGFDVLYASGSLQYLPLPLSQLLSDLPRLPRRLVINTTPIHATRSFFTLNSIGTAFCPYRVQAHDSFVDSLIALGYEKRGEWENTGKAMRIPFEPAYDVPHYSGFCFDLKA
ncbi:TIGR04325 family methyltransferase [Caldimonas brevitalea]|uniref:Methyltransferase, TIGR04325 family n=1 Tax=Caldimonas brevitalea TaxID=413882 RepID=A0A0G3BRY2_9BURK|nr:TIGR04325 family methyltransferase [Caldimonas brevitalea]AKJ32182.1 hypothetical protein AAW51_5491 [Caldimonas brevitalea]